MLDTSYNHKATYHEAAMLAVEKLRSELKSAGISEKTITDIVKSGYHLNQISMVGIESTAKPGRCFLADAHPESANTENVLCVC